LLFTAAAVLAAVASVCSTVLHSDEADGAVAMGESKSRSGIGGFSMQKISDAPISVEPPELVETPADRRALALRIKRSVRRHAGGGIKALDVQVDHRTIRLGGRSVSFYCKQLAQQAAMRICGERQVINDIEVEAD
jgi:osmotically-inducible protein OsmY